MELYYAAGNQVIEGLRERGYEVFLDLKLHDIPNTVAGAVRSVAGVGASLLTVHAGGGEPMMKAAVQAASAPGAPKLLAVTVLTSMDAAELRAVGVGGAHGPGGTLHSQVLRLARLARAAGIDGLVCSAEEVEAVRAAMGRRFYWWFPEFVRRARRDGATTNGAWPARRRRLRVALPCWWWGVRSRRRQTRQRLRWESWRRLPAPSKPVGSYPFVGLDLSQETI